MSRILLVDDDHYLLVVTEQLLLLGGHQVFCAASGLSAMKILDREKIDLVITDILMPDMDGCELIIAVHKMNNPPRIIAMSGGSGRLDSEYLLGMARAMRADKILPKPFDLAAIDAVIAEALQMDQADISCLPVESLEGESVMNINRLDQNFLKTLKVLYVEDDSDTREQCSEFLRRPVGTLITAANGSEGLEAFIKHSPDIVVTDILMPYMDGLTMSYEIRGISPAVPIVVITAFEQSDYLMRAINIGVDKYVVKPVNSYLLFECLLECAHRLRAEKQLELVHDREIQTMDAKHHKIVAQLAGGMAHDYNNLLQAILGFASLAKMKLEPESESSVHLEQVDTCFTEARELGQMLLILSEDNSEYMNVGPLMPLMQRTIKEALVGSAVTLNIDLAVDDPDITFMEHQMILVFSSLATNAVEAMPSGGTLRLTSQITVLSERGLLPLMPGTYLHITLSDTGSGIPAEVLPKIFDPYFSTKQLCSQRGMGLSLALCHTIIIQHNGIITAESTVESGTTFHIWLPTTL